MVAGAERRRSKRLGLGESLEFFAKLDFDLAGAIQQVLD
jgi:hypothetical protein